jgi:CheY-like chemotaxis protein
MTKDNQTPPEEGVSIARLVHDLRNFMAPVRNVAHVLRKRGEADPDLKGLADLLDRQVAGVGGMLDGLLNPQRILRPAAVAESLPAAPAPAPTGHSPRRRILIADDNAALRTSLSGVLQDMGHETMTAADGAEALRVASTWKPDVVFLDIHMPGLNGFDVARQLRVQFAPAAMQLVMMSGDTLNELAVRGAKEAGFDDCIDKLSGIGVFENILAARDPAA